MYDRGWVKIGDKVPGLGTLSKDKINNLKLYCLQIYPKRYK
jgi:hypothetical protein